MQRSRSHGELAKPASPDLQQFSELLYPFSKISDLHKALRSLCLLTQLRIDRLTLVLPDH